MVRRRPNSNSRYCIHELAAHAGLRLAHVCQNRLSEGGAGGVNITLYGFSIMKEPLEKAILSGISPPKQSASTISTFISPHRLPALRR